MILKILAALSVSVILNAHTAHAQEQMFDFNKEEIMRMGRQTFQNSPDMNEMMHDAMMLIDVNQDNVISENEINGLSAGLPDEQQKSKVKELFHQADTNHNNRLESAEIKKFSDLWADFTISQKTDEFLSYMNSTPEENMKRMDASLAQLSALSEQLDKMDPSMMAQNLMTNIATAQADENYYQMDKNKNNCVTEKDFVAYNLEYQKTITTDASLAMSADDYAEMYKAIPKKSPTCLTKEEYQKFYQDIAVEPMDLSLPE